MRSIQTQCKKLNSHRTTPYHRGAEMCPGRPKKKKRPILPSGPGISGRRRHYPKCLYLHCQYLVCLMRVPVLSAVPKVDTHCCTAPAVPSCRRSLSSSGLRVRQCAALIPQRLSLARHCPASCSLCSPIRFEQIGHTVSRGSVTASSRSSCATQQECTVSPW